MSSSSRAGQCSSNVVVTTAGFTRCFLFSLTLRSNLWEDFGLTKIRKKIYYRQPGTKIMPFPWILCHLKGHNTYF